MAKPDLLLYDDVRVLSTALPAVDDLDALLRRLIESSHESGLHHTFPVLSFRADLNVGEAIALIVELRDARLMATAPKINCARTRVDHEPHAPHLWDKADEDEFEFQFPGFDRLVCQGCQWT